MRGKVDNGNLAAKLALRRVMLRRWLPHLPARPAVLDCCCGDSVLWGKLRAEFAVDYVGMDEKPKPGRLRGDSRRLLAAGGWDFDVVDVDAYGEPWAWWLAICEHARRPTLVFLTVGRGMQGLTTVPKCVLDAVGLGGLEIPHGLGGAVRSVALPFLLDRARPRLAIADAVESEQGVSAQYYGLFLRPA